MSGDWGNPPVDTAHDFVPMSTTPMISTVTMTVVLPDGQVVVLHGMARTSWLPIRMTTAVEWVPGDDGTMLRVLGASAGELPWLVPNVG